MLSFDEVNILIDEIVAGIPEPILRGLNGGVNLVPGLKMHPKARRSDLYIMGEYCYQPYGLGRVVYIYYGSLERLYGYAPDETVAKAVKDTIYHELTHHLEGLAGDRSLEVEDAVNLARYLNRG